MFLELVRAANVLARPRKRGELDVPDAIGEEGDGKEWVGVRTGVLSGFVDGD